MGCFRDIIVFDRRLLLDSISCLNLSDFVQSQCGGGPNIKSKVAQLLNVDFEVKRVDNIKSLNISKNNNSIISGVPAEGCLSVLDLNSPRTFKIYLECNRICLDEPYNNDGRTEGVFERMPFATFDLRDIDATDVSSVNSLFANCIATKIIIDGWDLRNVSDMKRMFAMCTKLESMNLNNIQAPTDVYIDDLFKYCKVIKDIRMKSFDKSLLKIYNDTQDSIFLMDKKLTSIETSNMLIMDHIAMWNEELEYLA